jgi:hypothetical protein
MNTKHTPEPWRVSTVSDYRVSASDGIGVCITDGVSPRRATNENAPNARRIVACVNACEGISTEDLEENKNPGAARSTNDRLRAINAELLAALQQRMTLEPSPDMPDRSQGIAEAQFYARAAIAKATQ